MNKVEVKKIRIDLGLTQKEFADKLDSNIRTVQKWESGESKIRKTTAFMIMSLRNKGINSSEEKTPYLEKEGVKMSLKEAAELVANNYNEAKRICRLLQLESENDIREGVKKTLEEAGFLTIIKKKDD